MDDLETTDNQLRDLGAALNARREAQADPARARRVLAERFVGSGSGRKVLSQMGAPAPRSWTRRAMMAVVPLGLAVAAYVVVKPIFFGETGLPTAREVQEYRTQRAERSTFTLADGTRVTLGPESVLRVTLDTDARAVALQGQAYFSVTSNTRAPFTVKTQQSVTRVLGTAFTVRAYPTDTVTQVAVAEGRVATGRTEASTVVLPGDVAYVTVSEGPVVSHHGRTADIFGWMQGRLVSDGQAFKDVISDIERMYDITIVLQQREIGDRDLRATLTEQSVKGALDLIAEILGVQYTQQGHRVVFSTTPGVTQ